MNSNQKLGLVIVGVIVAIGTFGPGRRPDKGAASPKETAALPSSTTNSGSQTKEALTVEPASPKQMGLIREVVERGLTVMGENNNDAALPCHIYDHRLWAVRCSSGPHLNPAKVVARGQAGAIYPDLHSGGRGAISRGSLDPGSTLGRCPVEDPTASVVDG
jgi:hypothetical protein